MSLFGMPAGAMTAHSHAVTSVGTDGGASTSARMAKCCTTGTVHDGQMLYRASKFDCDICTLKMKCCPSTPARQVPRDINEHARDVARRLMRTKAFPKSRDERKRVEMRFAHLKVHRGFERMRLRGLSSERSGRLP